MPQHHTPVMTSPNDTEETWDDDFEFQSNASSRSSKTNKQKPASSSLLPPHATEEESWDDAYEDEDTHNRLIAQPSTRSTPPSKPDTDEGSWGSSSDWSGDGDAEDVSHESYIGPPVRSSSEPQAGMPFPLISNSLMASNASDTPSPPSASLFSKISPVRKWRAREPDETPKAIGKDLTKFTKTESGNGWTQQLASPLVQKRDSKLQIIAPGSQQGDAVSQLRPVFSVVNPSLATARTSMQSHQTVIASSVEPASGTITPLTPDLTHSPETITSTSPMSPLSLSAVISTAKPTLPSASFHISRSKGHGRPSTANSSLSPALSLPFLSSSTHNLPLTTQPAEISVSHFTPRRSSLSDLKRPQLKIPDRISRAQRDIKRDMDDVKEFAACVAQLKSFQHVYAILLRDLRTAHTHSEASPPLALSVAPLTNSPTAFSGPHLPSFSPKKRRGTLAASSPQSSPTKPVGRKFSLVSSPTQSSDRYTDILERLDAKYSVWWECAELLIELGGRKDGTGAKGDEEGDGSDEDASLKLGPAAGMTRGRRPRAMTLVSDTPGSAARPKNMPTGPPLASPVKPAQRRATMGRVGGRELTPRQLALLRGMLETDVGAGWDPRMAGVERMPREIGDEGSVRGKGKGKAGRGIRYLWRGLKKGTSAVAGGSGSGGSTGESIPRGSSSCDSSTSDRVVAIGERGTLTSRTPGTPSSSRGTVKVVDTAVPMRRKPPTRRPSLAGIFGIGQKSTKVEAEAEDAGTEIKQDTSSSDWDGMDKAKQVSNTIRGTNRLKSKGSLAGFSTPSPSLRLRYHEPTSSPDKSSPGASPRPQLIISFPEGLRDAHLSSSPGDSDTSRRKRLFRSVNSHGRSENTAAPDRSLGRLALTPENIRPLLGHAQDVKVHLDECISEVRHIIGGTSVI